MSGISARLARRVHQDFPRHADQVTATLADLERELIAEDSTDHAGHERVLAAVVLFANGDLRRVGSAADLARIDWRDLLVAAGLENDNWKAILSAELGTSDLPEPGRSSGR